ncbi:MAG: hypothetical protein KGO47_07375 [Cyanobacteria bacterium REEB417]|nr:hypothetical protein [Cyanobacteria bacterium REEB417]
MAVTTYHQVFEQKSFEAAANMQELAVLQTMLDNGPLFAALPFKDIVGASEVFNLEDELPIVNARLLDENPSNTRGSSIPQSVITAIYTADIKTDVQRLAREGRGAHDTEVLRTARALRMQIESDFVRGSLESSSGRSFNGLSTLIPAVSTNSQAVANHATGAAPKLSALDDMLNQVDAAPSQKVIIMPRALRPALQALRRDQSLTGNLQIETNALGQPAMFYDEAEIILTDVDPYNTPIQGFTEGSGSNTCSIYCVALGEDSVYMAQGQSMVNGELQPGLVVYDVGESFTSTHYLTRINLDCAAVIKNPRKAARLYNVTKANFAA